VTSLWARGSLRPTALPSSRRHGDRTGGGKAESGAYRCGVLKEKRPDIRCVALAETLSAVNRAGLAERYKEMYIDYRDTGLFKKDM